jgi:hypothetical protein
MTEETKVERYSYGADFRVRGWGSGCKRSNIMKCIKHTGPLLRRREMRPLEPSVKDDYSDMDSALEYCRVPAKVDLVVGDVVNI